MTKASITLNDCLACSGCITSAESVLIGQQNSVELLKLFEELKSQASERMFDNVVVALSYQPVLSFAAKFNITPILARAKLASEKLVLIYLLCIGNTSSIFLQVSSKTWVLQKCLM